MLNDDLQAIDQAQTFDSSNPREATVQQNLLQLLKGYPEAAKYLGPAALAHLQKMNLMDPQTAARRDAIVKGLQNAQ